MLTKTTIFNLINSQLKIWSSLFYTKAMLTLWLLLEQISLEKYLRQVRHHQSQTTRDMWQCVYCFLLISAEFCDPYNNLFKK